MTRLTEKEVEARAYEAFIGRLKGFLVADPFWMHVLATDGGRGVRRRLGTEVARLVTTIPHRVDAPVVGRELRRKFDRKVRSEQVRSNVGSTDVSEVQESD